MREDKPYLRGFQSALSLLDEFSGQKGVLLVSGGRDSMVLLDAVLRLKPSIRLECLHFNYQLRGEESLRDEDFVRRVCGQKGVPLTVERVSLAGKASIQERARTHRYRRLKELAPKSGWQFALTAHHGDDQIETIVMRLMRGCGLRGLQGIKLRRPLGELTLLRPLLTLRRDELQDYLRDQAIDFVEDSSNASDKYLRNRIRHKGLPGLLDAQEAQSVLDRSFEIQNYFESIQGSVERFLASSRRGPAHFIDRLAYQELDTTQRFLVAEKILKFHGYRKECGQDVAGRFESAVIHAGPPLRLDKAELSPHSRGLWVMTCQDPQSLDEVNVPGPGEYRWGSLTIRVQTLSMKEARAQSEKTLLVDASKVGWPLRLRRVKPGDRFHPFGRPGSKKVSDFLIDRKIPRALRCTHPLLTNDDGIICVLGLEIDHKYQLDDMAQCAIGLVRSENG